MRQERRRIAVFTGTRAEFGLLTPTLRELREAEDVDLCLIVAGAHLSLLHGMTVTEIEREGFSIDARIEMLLASDTPAATTKALGLAFIDLASALERLAPDLLLVLGDRYETLAAATAATIAGIPIAHLHGGEITEGAFDDAIRHAVTKLSHLHFVATDDFRQRVLQLGEESGRIWVVGAASLDAIAGLGSVPRKELERAVGATLEDEFAVVMYHPSTIPGEDPGAAVREMLSGLAALDSMQLLCFLPNADPIYGPVRDEIQAFAEGSPSAVEVSSLPHGLFLSLLGLSSVMIGNSSAGIVEAPLLGTATVNVGQRQEGRPRAPSIIDVPPEASAIRSACERALSAEFQRIVEARESPYQAGVSAGLIVSTVVREVDLSRVMRKRFQDLPLT